MVFCVEPIHRAVEWRSFLAQTFIPTLRRVVSVAGVDHDELADALLVADGVCSSTP